MDKQGEEEHSIASVGCCPCRPLGHKPRLDRQTDRRAQARHAPVLSRVCCSSARAMLAAAMPAMAPHIIRACHGAVSWCQTLRQGAGQQAAPSLRGTPAAAPTAAGSKPTSSTAGGVAPCNYTLGCCATTLRARSDCWASRGAGRCRSDSTKPLLDRPPPTWCFRVYQQCDLPRRRATGPPPISADLALRTEVRERGFWPMHVCLAALSCQLTSARPPSAHTSRHSQSGGTGLSF